MTGNNEEITMLYQITYISWMFVDSQKKLATFAEEVILFICLMLLALMKIIPMAVSMLCHLILVS